MHNCIDNSMKKRKNGQGSNGDRKGLATPSYPQVVYTQGTCHTYYHTIRTHFKRRQGTPLLTFFTEYPRYYSGDAHGHRHRYTSIYIDNRKDESSYDRTMLVYNSMQYYCSYRIKTCFKAMMYFTYRTYFLLGWLAGAWTVGGPLLPLASPPWPQAGNYGLVLPSSCRSLASSPTQLD